MTPTIIVQLLHCANALANCSNECARTGNQYLAETLSEKRDELMKLLEYATTPGCGAVAENQASTVSTASAGKGA